MRSKRNAVANTIVLEIDDSDEPITNEETTINNNNDAVLEKNTNFAETIIAATLNNEIPADLDLIPQVAVQTVTPPTVPECLADEIAENSNTDNAFDPDYVPGKYFYLSRQVTLKSEKVGKINSKFRRFMLNCHFLQHDTRSS